MAKFNEKIQNALDQFVEDYAADQAQVVAKVRVSKDPNFEKAIGDVQNNASDARGAIEAVQSKLLDALALISGATLAASADVYAARDAETVRSTEVAVNEHVERKKARDREMKEDRERRKARDAEYPVLAGAGVPDAQ